MRIGELAAEAGVNVQTIRFYERRGLLREPVRLMTGYRSYSAEAVGTIRFIKQSQKLGFTLEEVRALLQSRENQSTDPSKVRAIAQAKVREIDHRIRSLVGMRDELSRLLRTCECGDGKHPCLAFESMEEPRSRISSVRTSIPSRIEAFGKQARRSR